MTDTPLSTQTGADMAGARIEQLTIFISDRLGALHRALQILDGLPMRICSISILDGADHAVVRLIVDRSRVAARLLEDAGYSVLHRDLIGVALPKPEERGVGVRGVLRTLLAAEVKVFYAYPLADTVEGRAVLALNVEDLALAERALVGAGLDLVDQDQLGWGAEGA